MPTLSLSLATQDGWELRVTHRNQALMLSPSRSREGAVLDTISSVLDAAEADGTITTAQRTVLLKEISKRVVVTSRRGT